MRKTLLTMLATAAALCASAVQVELLTNGDGTTLDGWENTGDNANSHFAIEEVEEAFWFGTKREKNFVMGVDAKLSQTVTLADHGIAEDELLQSPTVTASVTVLAKDGSATCNVKVYQLDADGNMIESGTHTVLDRARQIINPESVVTNSFTINPATRKLKFELCGLDSKQWEGFYGPKFRNCSLVIEYKPVFTVNFMSEGTALGAGRLVGTFSTPPIAPRHGDDRFLGYFTTETGGEQVFNANYEYVLDVNPAWEATEGATLYAYWQPVPRKQEGGITRLVYRGVLTNFGEWTSGLKKNMNVKVYDSASAAEPLWSGNVADVPINPDGSFEAVFGNDELALAFASNDVTHVELTVGDALSPLAPRRAFASVASVNRALVAEGAASDIKIGTLGANALIAEKITAGTLEASETVRVEGSVSVEVKPFDIKRGQETTIWRGAGVTAWGDPEHVDTFNGVVAGQKLWTADRDGVVMIHCSGNPRSTLRIPATIQFVRPGDEVRAPTWDSGKVSVTFWGYKK